MPRVSASRTVATNPQRTFDVVGDPHHLPRWWPGISRVEDVQLTPGRRRSRWTAVLVARSGRPVRADYRCVTSAEGERFAWEQELEGTPFGKHLREARTEISLAPDPEGTLVTITAEHRLRGLSRLGGWMMRGAMRRQIREALDGLTEALGDPGGA